MITVMCIAGILMTIAIPSYRNFSQANRISGEINGLLGDLQYARAEAIKEGQTVTVCVLSTNASCASGTSTAWQNGWIVFADANSNHTINAGDTVYRIQSAFTSTDTLTSNNSVGYISFNREGFATGLGANGALIELHAATPSSVTTRCLSVTMVGLMTVQTYGQQNNSMTCQ
jgi:type IV fimbrial biogenesis protein FimT